MTSLSASAVNSLTSNPVGGFRFEMRFLPLMAVGVAGSGEAVDLLVSSGDARAAPAGGEGPNPPTLKAGGDNDGLSWWKATGRAT